jgi:YHS domain-containing protein
MKYLLSLLLFVSTFSYSQEPVYTGYFSNKALQGYDTVAYFTEQKPVLGSKQFVTEYKGADWYFSNAKHLAMFEQNPEKYAPQYGGYCAWAVAEKRSFAPADPHQWAVVNGKLYLNYDADIKSKWDKAPVDFINKANSVWPQLIAE